MKEESKIQSNWIKLLIWLGIMAMLTVLAMLGWRLIWGGSLATDSLKWLQLLQTIATFLLPPILCAWLWDEQHKPFTWLGLTKGSKWQVFILAVVIMLCAIPGINLLGDINSRIEFPQSLDFIEQILKAQEEAAADLTKRFLEADNGWILLINIGLLALLPAIAEELSFRGTLQQLLCPRTPHLAIWLTAVIFSAIHMQFYGFIPRMLMGALFGYVFVWTGSLWVPMVMHFTNNGVAILSYYFLDKLGDTEKSWADTIGAGSTWWLGLISLVVVGGLVYLLKVQGQQEFGRRTHIQ